ncbi:MAG TPA: M56 family metallopeptidase [Terriglobia bacterium]|nr:M56 family metallopeptidase [Terriglobia bacterium]
MTAALIRHLIESTVFAAIVAVFPFLMRKREAASRHLVWLIAASKFALPAALFSFAGIELRGLFPVHAALFAAPIGLSSFVRLQGAAAATARYASPLPLLLLAIWLCGSAMMLAVWLRRMRAPQGPFLAPVESENETLDDLARRLRVRGQLALRIAKARIEPSVTGIFRHTITVPEGLSKELEAREFEAVLLHELAHAKRRDNLTAGFVHVLVCVFWFHPLLWWIERRLAAEQERACDEIALRYGPAPEEYASGILKVCRFHLAGAAAGACGIAGSSLKNRLEAIMLFQPNRVNDRSPRVLIAALVSPMIVVPIVFGFLTSLPSFARVAKDEGHVSTLAASKNPITCLHTDGKSYPMGSVVEVGGVGVQQMCVETMQGHALWVRTFNDAARERSSKVIFIPPQPPFTCQPAPSGSEKFCGCQTSAGLVLMSPGAIVASADGGHLRCKLDGSGTWRAATPAERGIRGKN